MADLSNQLDAIAKSMSRTMEVIPKAEVGKKEERAVRNQDIRKARMDGRTLADIGKEFGLSRNMISILTKDIKVTNLRGWPKGKPRGIQKKVLKARERENSGPLDEMRHDTDHNWKEWPADIELAPDELIQQALKGEVSAHHIDHQCHSYVDPFSNLMLIVENIHPKDVDISGAKRKTR